MKIFGALARFFSTVLSPLLMPTYGVFLALWVSVLCYIPLGTRLMVILVVFGITCILPMVFIAVLHNAKIITDKRLDNRRERFGRPQSAADFYGASERLDDAGDHFGVLRRSRERSVKVDDVQLLAALVRPILRLRRRIIPVDRDVLGTPLT